MKDNKKTMMDVAEFVLTQLRAANIRNARIEMSGLGSPGASMTVERAFAVRGTLGMKWDVVYPEAETDVDGVRFKPVIEVNFPASNKSVIPAVAFLHLVQEVTMLAASIQVQIDEFGAVLPWTRA